MFRHLKEKFAAHSLRQEQIQVARELQAIFDQRNQLIAHENYLMRYSKKLAVKEFEMNITARRNQVNA
jgi:hypothetical protein